MRPSWVRLHSVALRVVFALTVIFGLAYPLAVTAVAQVGWGSKADGSLVRADGRVLGSRLIGQDFSGPTWFHPRPSAAGIGYDASASGASNLAPTSPKLLQLVRQRRAEVAAENGVLPEQVPPDAVTASGSGLDPGISPAHARLQVARVARARHLDPVLVRRLVDDHVVGRLLGVLGEPQVNVLLLNLALSRLH